MQSPFATQGASEEIAIKDLLSIYGSSFRSRVYVWFRLSRTIDADMRAIIAKQENFNQAWITENKFVIGEGAQKKYRMNATSLELAINLAPWVPHHGRLS